MSKSPNTALVSPSDFTIAKNEEFKGGSNGREPLYES